MPTRILKGVATVYQNQVPYLLIVAPTWNPTLMRWRLQPLSHSTRKDSGHPCDLQFCLHWPSRSKCKNKFHWIPYIVANPA